MDFSLVKPRENSFRAAFAVVLMVIGICSGSVLTPLVQIRENNEFHNLIQPDESSWSRCLLWHGWLPALAGSGAPFGWPCGPGQVASGRLETSLRAYSGRIWHEWVPPYDYAAEDARVQVSDFWTDGSLVRGEVSGVCFGGAAVHAHVTGSWGLFCSHFGRVGTSHDYSAEDARRLLPDLPDVWTEP